ncbi:MAG: hypothetical protein AAF348_18775 [Bacteroidota bacterium]
MIEKPDWLNKGARATAFGKPCTIKKCPTNEIKGKVYVYQCDIMYDDKNFTVPVHPSDLKPIN